MNHLLSLRDLESSTWHALLEDAERLVGRRRAGHLPLDGRRFGMLLLNPSLRTRTSFEVACYDLGALCVPLQPGQGLWDLETRDDVVMDGASAEHVREAVGVLGRMVDALGVRAFASRVDADADAREPVLSSIVAASSVPVLNLESAADHPHQGLADALTVRRRFGGRRVRVVIRWAPHVKALPMAVPNAALYAFAREGHDVVVARPPECALQPDVMSAADALARQAGGSVAVHETLDGSTDGAHVVYAKSWGPSGLYGDETGTAAFLAAHRDWIVDGAAMGAARPDAAFMHCLPVRRGVVVTPDVLEGATSLVLDQAAARLDVQKATLCHAVEAAVPPAAAEVPVAPGSSMGALS